MSKKHKGVGSDRRRKYLHAQLEKYHDLCCVNCKQRDLIILHKQDPDIPYHRRATIDHIRSISLGGSKYNKENWQVLCEKCNLNKNKMEQLQYGK